MADEAGWLATLFLVAAATTAVLGDLGDIYVVGDVSYPFSTTTFLLVSWGALVASRWLFLGARSIRFRQVSRALALGVVVLAFLAASGRFAVAPLSDVLDWHRHGFPAPRRYPGTQRWEIEALLLLRSLVPLATLFAGAAIALGSRPVPRD